MDSGDDEDQKVIAVGGIAATPSADPGDETERNFRYQHQYGVVLLAAVRRGALNYVSLYCEHHEDFLAERPDGLYDGYQVKTSKPENGAWTLTSEPLTKSIGRFVDLLADYPDQIGKLVFVSNSDVDSVGPDHKNEAKRSRCPNLMLEHVQGCVGPDDIQSPFRKAFDSLAAEIAADPARLFQVLRHLEFVKGPSREDFDAVLAQEHVGALDECAHLAPGPLRDLCNDLVGQFHRAASLFVVDPNRHLAGTASGTVDDQTIKAKRIICAEVVLVPPRGSSDAFRFQGSPRLTLGQPRPRRVLEQKLARGGVEELAEYMREREQAAEYHFLEEQAKDPITADKQLRQVEAAVHGECLEAFMAAKTSSQPFGQAMFNDVSQRLRTLESTRQGLLGGEPYEVLMGTAALLTSGCRVWWSERFQVGGGDA